MTLMLNYFSQFLRLMTYWHAIYGPLSSYQSGKMINWFLSPASHVLFIAILGLTLLPERLSQNKWKREKELFWILIVLSFRNIDYCGKPQIEVWFFHKFYWVELHSNVWLHNSLKNRITGGKFSSSRDLPEPRIKLDFDCRLTPYQLSYKGSLHKLLHKFLIIQYYIANNRYRVV